MKLELIKKNTKHLSILLFISLCIFHIRFGIIPGCNKIVSDFPNYYVASKMIADGKDALDLYDKEKFQMHVYDYGVNAAAQFALYPPASALLMLPISGLQPLTAKRIWLLIQVCCIGGLILLTTSLLNVTIFTSGNLILLSGFNLSNDLMLGQIYIFITLLLFTGIYCVMKNKTIIAGISWGTVISLKYMPLAFIPTLIISKKWKTLLLMLMCVLIIYGITSIMMGTHVVSQFISNIFIPHLKGDVAGERSWSLQYQSFEVLLNHLFIQDAVHNPHPLQDSLHFYYLIKFVIYSLVLGATIRIITIFRNTPYFIPFSISSVTLSVLLLEPGSATYHLLFALLPLILIIRQQPFQTFTTFSLIVVFSLMGFLPVVIDKLISFYQIENKFVSLNRLWLEMVFFIAAHNVMLLKSQKRITHT